MSGANKRCQTACGDGSNARGEQSSGVVCLVNCTPQCRKQSDSRTQSQNEHIESRRYNALRKQSENERENKSSTRLHKQRAPEPRQTSDKRSVNKTVHRREYSLPGGSPATDTEKPLRRVAETVRVECERKMTECAHRRDDLQPQRHCSKQTRYAVEQTRSQNSDARVCAQFEERKIFGVKGGAGV